MRLAANQATVDRSFAATRRLPGGAGSEAFGAVVARRLASRADLTSLNCGEQV